MSLSKKQIKLLKEAEINLYYAHETMRELNKDIFGDEGQEYPVPFIHYNPLFTETGKPTLEELKKEKERLKK